MDSQFEPIYHGETSCQAIKYFSRRDGKPVCSNKATFFQDGRYYCAIHAKSDARIMLPTRRWKDKITLRDNELTLHLRGVEEEAEKNRSSGLVGQVRLVKMEMMKKRKKYTGWRMIFIDFAVMRRKEGNCFPSLHPKRIGPIYHRQPGIPVANNLEGLYHGNTVYPEELDTDGNLTVDFYRNRQMFYEKSDHPRYKYRGKKPVFSVWVTAEGSECRLNYLDSRKLYCDLYVEFVEKHLHLLVIRSFLEEGYNLAIYGYDAHPIDYSEGIVKGFQEAYLNPDQRFGHERILAAMLLLNPHEYPWRSSVSEEYSRNLSL